MVRAGDSGAAAGEDVVGGHLKVVDAAECLAQQGCGDVEVEVGPEVAGGDAVAEEPENLAVQFGVERLELVLHLGRELLVGAERVAGAGDGGDMADDLFHSPGWGGDHARLGAHIAGRHSDNWRTEVW